MVLLILVYAAEICLRRLNWLSWALEPPARRRSFWRSSIWATRRKSLRCSSSGFRGLSSRLRGGDLYGAPHFGPRGRDLYDAPHLVFVGSRAAGAAEIVMVLHNLVYAAENFVVLLIWFSWALEPPARRRPLRCSPTWSTRQRSSHGWAGLCRTGAASLKGWSSQRGSPIGELDPAPVGLSVGALAAGRAG